MTGAGDSWLDLLRCAADAVQTALAGFDRWHVGGDRPDQYALDQVADAAALEVLDAAGVGVLSEESGLRNGTGSEVVIVDPVDGSTNASRRIPHYSISLCLVDSSEARGNALNVGAEAGGVTPRAGLVRHLVSGEEFTATVGDGAHCNGQPISPSGRTSGERAVIGVSGRSGADLPVWQVRVLGSAALDLCAVACGRLDAYLDLNSNHGVWDYAAGILICAEAGAWTGEADGRELFHLEHSGRRGPMAAGTAQLAGLLDGFGRRGRR
ncbi:inositol monophosphatase family protein [Candidatus Poriferisodalis sp.]|uniref:inositol monophosphatase family protein n=1 Tax=Candidatus Poriferisodalis sp. TaxID=3101277 RepID=UPI003B02D765